jgi:hypothetical protein
MLTTAGIAADHKSVTYRWVMELDLRDLATPGGG